MGPVCIEIRRDRIDVGVRRGDRLAASRRIPVDLSADSAKWAKELRECGEALKEAVGGLGAERGRADVFCATPSQAVVLVSLHAKSESDACDAAVMQSLGSVTWPAESAVSDAIIIARDRTGRDRKKHVVSVLEQNEVAGAIAEVVRAAGLRLNAIRPVEGSMISAALHEAFRESEVLRGILWVGEHSSFFAIARDGRLRLARHIRIGIESVIRSLTIDLHRPGTTDSISFEYERAADIVMEFGIPERDQVVDGGLDLRGAHLMPALQPVLQRLIVELRQSLRFGLNTRERSDLAIDLCGPGASLPRLGALLQTELGVPVREGESAHAFDHRTPGSEGSDLAAAIRETQAGRALAVLPREAAAERTVGRIRKWAWIGAAASLALVAFDAVRLQSQIRHARTIVNRSASVAVTHTAFREARNRFIAVQSVANDLDNTIHSAMRGAGAGTPFLYELSRLTPIDVRLTGVTLSYRDERATATLVGYAVGGLASSGGGSVLSAYLESLRASPLVRGVELRSAQESSVESVPAERFELDVSLVIWSDALVEEALTARAGEGSR